MRLFIMLKLLLKKPKFIFLSLVTFIFVIIIYFLFFNYVLVYEPVTLEILDQKMKEIIIKEEYLFLELTFIRETLIEYPRLFDIDEYNAFANTVLTPLQMNLKEIYETYVFFRVEGNLEQAYDFLILFEEGLDVYEEQLLKIESWLAREVKLMP